jgi:hypothetical protein
MAIPRVADGRDGLRQWKVAANILSKKPRTNDKGWSSNLEGGRRANNPSQSKASLLRNASMSHGPGRILWKNALAKENGHENWDTEIKESV